MRSTFYFIPIWALALLGNFIFAGVSFPGQKFDPITFNAPPAEKVKEISAQLYNRPDGGPDIEIFKLPSTSHQQILKALDGALEDEDPVKWQALGNLDIVLHSGSFEIHLFWTNQTTGAFMVNDVYYRGSSDEELIRLISDAAKLEG